MYLLSAEQTQSGLFAVFSPDGERVITGDVGIAAVKIWDLSLEGDAEVFNVRDGLSGPRRRRVPPGREVAASHDRGSVAIWDVASPGRKRSGRSAPGSGGPEPVVRVAVNRDGTRLATIRNFTGRRRRLVSDDRRSRVRVQGAGGRAHGHSIGAEGKAFWSRLRRRDHGVRSHRGSVLRHSTRLLVGSSRSRPGVFSPDGRLFATGWPEGRSPPKSQCERSGTRRPAAPLPEDLDGPAPSVALDVRPAPGA